MSTFDVFITAGGNYWYVLWNRNLARPIYLSDLFGSLPHLLTHMVEVAKKEGVDLSLIIDSPVVPPKMGYLERWKKREMFTEVVELPGDPESLAIQR